MGTGSAKEDLAGHLSTISQISEGKTNSNTDKKVFGADEDKSTEGFERGAEVCAAQSTADNNSQMSFSTSTRQRNFDLGVGNIFFV